MNAPENIAPNLPACLADLDEARLRAVRDMIDALSRAAEAVDLEAEFSLIADGDAVTMTLTVSVPVAEGV